jgi:hypothetical protein
VNHAIITELMAAATHGWEIVHVDFEAKGITVMLRCRLWTHVQVTIRTTTTDTPRLVRLIAALPDYDPADG